MKRIGLYSSAKRKQILEKPLSGNYIDWRDSTLLPIDSALAAWQASDMDIIVIDDESCPDKYTLEEVLLSWVTSIGATSSRIIFVADPNRPVDDPYYYQLVSRADVKDIINTAIGHTIEETLPLRIDTPTRIQEVSYWKTTDKTKLIRPKERKGLAGALAKRRERKNREKILEAALAANAANSAIEPEEGTPMAKKDTTEVATEKVNEIADIEQNGQSDSENIKQETLEEVEEVVEKTKEEGSVQEAEDDVSEVCENDEEDVSENLPTPQETKEETTLDMSALWSLSNIEEPTHAQEEFSLTCPTAKKVIAVAGVRRGTGCTHLACSLARELADTGARSCVAIYDSSTFDAMKSVLSPHDLQDGMFSHGPVDYYSYFAQREYAQNYDYVVVDCGTIDYPETDPNYPALLFARADERVLICSGSPWDFVDTGLFAQRLGSGSLLGVKWFCFGASREVANAIGALIRDTIGVTSEIDISLAPYRPDLFFPSGRPRAYTRAYASVLKPLLDGVTIKPHEFQEKIPRHE